MDITMEAFKNAVADACRAGIESEQARIIKLLEDYVPVFYELSPNSDASKYPVEGIITLIKGETK